MAEAGKRRQCAAPLEPILTVMVCRGFSRKSAVHIVGVRGQKIKQGFEVVALCPTQDLLLCGKHLFVADIVSVLRSGLVNKGGSRLSRPRASGGPQGSRPCARRASQIPGGP
jgi:hypothetical protein